MNGRTVTLTTCVVLALSAFGLARSAQAGDFFSELFGAFRRSAPPPMPLPFANPFAPAFEVPRARPGFGGGQAWCVRTCDGRYFPVQGPDRESRASSCSNFCPAANTEVVYGGDIDSAVTDSGKTYSDLPNAFRYRDELVAGCTCNGKEPAGLAQVPVQSDPTLRRGDIVASENGHSWSPGAPPTGMRQRTSRRRRSRCARAMGELPSWHRGDRPADRCCAFPST